MIARKTRQKIPSLLSRTELLRTAQESRASIERRIFILLNNKNINVEYKLVFWKAWRIKYVPLVQDLLNNQGNYLSPQEFSGINITSKLIFSQFPLIIHQIFSLAPDWSKRVTWVNIPQLKLGHIRGYAPIFRYSPVFSVA